MNLQKRFTFWICALVTVIAVTIAGLVVLLERQTMFGEMIQSHQQAMERLVKVCEESLYQSDVVLLNYFNSIRSERGFVAAGFIDGTGRVQLHTDPRLIGSSMETPYEAAADSADAFFSQHYKNATGQMILDLAAPVRYGGRRAGTARLLLDDAVLKRFIWKAMLRTVKTIGFILLIALLVGFMGAALLAKTLVTPIQRIVAAMREISKGKLESTKLPERSDELGWLGHELNVTVDKLRQLEDMKRNFFSQVTHELRSPLGAIDGFVSLLLKGMYGPLTTSVRDPLLGIQNHTLRLSRFVDDLLTTSKIEAGREEYTFERFELKDLLSEIASLYSPVSIEKKIPLVIDCPAGTRVNADREKIAQVVTNLVSNAFKFTKAGTIGVRARTSGDVVTLGVWDTGAGIPVADKPHLFDRFFRGGSTKNIKGTGLGLSIVKSIVDGHHGTLTVEDNPNGGTGFIFTLPSGTRHSTPPN